MQRIQWLMENSQTSNTSVSLRKYGTTIKQKQMRSSQTLTRFCFHLPYTKMGMKAFKPFLEEMSEEEQERFTVRYQEAAAYNRQVGNIYTGSLFLSFISLLENSSVLVAGDRIGFFSYGSGAVGEFFAGELVEGFEDQLHIAEHKALLENRKMLTVEEYEEIFTEVVDASGEQTFTREDNSPITLTAVVDHQRQYTIK